MRPYGAELQRTNQTRTTSKHSTEFNYSDFPCHLKVNRDKLALINRQWKCKKGKRLTIRANLFTKIDQHDDSARREQLGGKIPPAAESIRLQDLSNSVCSTTEKRKKNC